VLQQVLLLDHLVPQQEQPVALVVPAAPLQALDLNLTLS
jgi:hypothetical protein